MKAKKPSKKKLTAQQKAEAAARELVEQDQWVAAIKVYRNGSGCGLAEAVEVVRKMREEFHKTQYGF